MKGWSMFNKIKHFKNQKLKITQVARILHADVRTIKKYWDMTPDDFEILRASYKQRIVGRKMDIYHDIVLQWITEFNDISAAQIFDWIKEKYPEFSMSERTVRDYVNKIRKDHNLPKHKVSRQFMAVAETEPGEQAQVDMGQITLKTSENTSKKVYLFSMSLSFSRYKFAIWQDRPFNSIDIIQHHHKAFLFFNGVPKTIVYDQDRTMFIKENFGDIIKTDLFQKYVNTMNFKVHLCRAYDPQSKGKIEAVVKYVKNNFAKNRVFTNIDDFNSLCFEWLNRTGNGKEHSTIKKVPAEMFLLEKDHLQPVLPFLFDQQETNNILQYSLSKDNTVTYKSNRYQLPKGTYSNKCKEIGVVCENIHISFLNLETKEIIKTYEISKEKGKLISNIPVNKLLSSKVLELKSSILKSLNNDIDAVKYIEKIEKLKGRYLKSQLNRLNDIVKENSTGIMLEAVKKAITKENYNLDYLIKLVDISKKKDEVTVAAVIENVPTNMKGVTPEIREISIYEDKLVKL